MFEQYFAPHSLEEETEFMPLFSVEEEPNLAEDENIPDILPILALKNTVLYPGIIIPITVGRDKSLKAIQQAYEADRYIAVLSQKDTKIEDPKEEDLFIIGTVAKIIKLLKMPDGTATAILQGRRRFTLVELLKTSPYLEGKISVIKETDPIDELEFKAMTSSIRDMAQQIIQLSPNIPSEAIVMLKNITEDYFLLNFIASNLGISVEVKQQILEIDDPRTKAEMILGSMENELRILELKDQIESKVRGDIEKQQRDYYLNQQLKTIQDELGQNPQEEEVKRLREKAKEKKWGKNVEEAFMRELKKLARTNPQAPEYSVLLNYLELLTDLPWEEFTVDNFNLAKVKQTLDKDHHGLEDVKDRILEHLAVLKLKGDMKAPIICLVGPPGVGKTSLGKSIANALQRKFIRMSLGGLHDESEIRGHRRTYIGAMPGRIIQSLKKVKASNPVFILDEIDKVGKDFRGDPSSALLEVLDPEQNSTFHDNFLELEYDLSKVMFIATANSLSTIQPALLDRMEVIEISGYSLEEKVEITRRHLIPQQLEAHGLKAKQVKLRPQVIGKIIQNYTRESGVRSLNRTIGSVMRRIAKKVAMEESYDPRIKKEDLQDLLGPARFSNDTSNEKPVPGVAIGLAWTQVGGDILYIEASLSQGKGKLLLTGNLGDVMKESATTALSYIKANGADLGIPIENMDKYDIHIHVPEGAIPKDGPSAGITMLSALTSAFTGRPLRSNIAMTGEITLRGKVLPVGGIKEKVLAAKRAGIKEIILCEINQKNVEQIQSDFIKGMTFHYVAQMEEVLDIALSKRKVVSRV